MHDCLIVGGGPAGLSAALVLGRCRRKVIVCDAGHPRNAAAEHMHGYLTRDHTEPAEVQRLGLAEIRKYAVEFRQGEAVAARPLQPGFEVTLDDGATLRGRTLLLATGVRDILPEIEGLQALYGRSVHHCPYCDGYEHRDQRLIALGKPSKAVGLALCLLTWSTQVTACTNGEEADPESADLARRAGIPLRTEPISRLVSQEGRLAGIELAGGECVPAEALFFNTGQVQRTPLAKLLGCRFKDDGGVLTSERQCTDVPGLYVAGDADKDVQFVIVAAAEGATAAVAMNRELQDRDRAAPAGEARQK